MSSGRYFCAAPAMSATLGAVVLGLSAVAWADDPPGPAATTHLASADPRQPSTSATEHAPDAANAADPSPRAISAQSRQQTVMARHAQQLPGRSCDPDGPIYQVVDANDGGSLPVKSDRTDLLIHFSASGRPDEVRFERSSGDADLDARVAEAVCDRARADPSDSTADAGWARLTVRLIGP